MKIGKLELKNCYDTAGLSAAMVKVELEQSAWHAAIEALSKQMEHLRKYIDAGVMSEHEATEKLEKMVQHHIADFPISTEIVKTLDDEIKRPPIMFNGAKIWE